MAHTLHTDTIATRHLENAEEFIVLFVHRAGTEAWTPHHCYTHTQM